MENKKVDAVLMACREKISVESLSIIKDLLLKIDDDQYSSIMMVVSQMKDATTAVALDALLCAGRIYIGETGKGIAMIAVALLTCGIGWIWGVIDAFMIGTATRKLNSDMLIQQLNAM